MWGRPLANGGVAAVFFNRGEVPRDISASFAELGLVVGRGEVVAVDVWSGKVRDKVPSPFTALAVPPHATVFVTLTTQ